MSISASAFSAGYTGCKVISNTTATTGRFRGFVINDDAVISAILNKSGASILASLGLAGVTLRSGVFISVPDGDYISSITLTYGSIVVYGE